MRDGVQWLRTLDAERDERGRERHALIKSALHLFQQKLPWMAVAGGAAAWIGLKIDPSLLNSTLAFWCLVRTCAIKQVVLRLFPAYTTCELNAHSPAGPCRSLFTFA
jgi:hypothetical protein